MSLEIEKFLSKIQEREEYSNMITCTNASTFGHMAEEISDSQLFASPGWCLVSLWARQDAAHDKEEIGEVLKVKKFKNFEGKGDDLQKLSRFEHKIIKKFKM